jgi:uncharacterized protein (TIGR03086 family)
MAEASDIATLRRACGLAESVLRGVDEEQLGGRTPCRDWTVQELMEHLVASTDFFADVAALGALPDDKEWAEYASRDLVPAFGRQVERLLAAFEAEGAMTRPMRLPSGDTTGVITIQVAVGELFVHSWDLATATGQVFSDEGIADVLLASDWIALCEQVRAASPPAFAAVFPSDGGPSVEQLVAFLGRDPHFTPD